VLILQGDTDRQVTPDQADTLAAALTAAGNRDVTLRRFPDTNHLFLADPSGDPQRYAALPDSRIRREVLGALVEWAVRVGAPAPH
jgi:dipeptidyl aminopeptidase/acylaminoacyl peptidase